MQSRKSVHLRHVHRTYLHMTPSRKESLCLEYGVRTLTGTTYMYNTTNSVQIIARTCVKLRLQFTK